MPEATDTLEECLLVAKSELMDMDGNVMQVSSMPTRKDWEPLRQLARKRAYITLRKVWEDPAKDCRIYRAEYRRFCYRDYDRGSKGNFSVCETSTGISLKHTCFDGEPKANRVKSHYCISFKRGRLAFYSRRVMTPTVIHIHHTLPFRLKLLAPIENATILYPEVEARFSRRLAKMVRSKARQNGVKLPKGDDLKQLLTDTLFPALAAVKAQHAALRHTNWEPSEPDRWLLRHMRCSVAELPKRMTGYKSKAVTRLFWQAMNPNTTPTTPIVTLDWQAKWSWLALLRTWLPVDYTQAILRAPAVASWDASFTKEPDKLRRFMKQWEPRRVVRMLTETCADAFTIRDTMRMLEAKKAADPTFDRRFPDCQAMHDFFVDEQTLIARQRQLEWARRRLEEMTPEARAREQARIAAQNAKDEEPLPIEYGEKVADKVVITPDGKTYSIILPATGKQLFRWGDAMHNCIGSYAVAVRMKESQIFGVKGLEDERVCHWGIEVKDKRVVQFRGTCNAEPPIDLRKTVETALFDAGIIESYSDSIRDHIDALLLAANAAMGIPREEAMRMGLIEVDNPAALVQAPPF